MNGQGNIDLRNDHNVYILGAGFSRAAGLPLINDFLVHMRDSHEWLQAQRRIVEADAVTRVLRFRLDAASAAYWVNLDLENIEELFSLSSAKKGRMELDIRLAIAATIDQRLLAGNDLSRSRQATAPAQTDFRTVFGNGLPAPQPVGADK